VFGHARRFKDYAVIRQHPILFALSFWFSPLLGGDLAQTGRATASAVLSGQKTAGAVRTKVFAEVADRYCQGRAILEGSGKRSLAYVAAAIIVAGVLVSATLILVPLSHSRTTVTEVSVTTASTTTATITSTVTMTSTGVTTDYVAVNDSGDSALLADCQSSQSYGYSSGTLVVGASSPAIICLQVYDFNSTNPIVLNATSLLDIEGYLPEQMAGGPSILGANFTVAASADQLLLGGPTNANEGTILAFAITAKPGASGTYWLGVAQLPRGFQLGSGGPYYCGPNGQLVAVSGQPDYVPSDETQICVTIIAGTNSTQFSIPGVGYTVPGGVLLYRIIGLMNSTQ
jgi:hypothetical protein